MERNHYGTKVSVRPSTPIHQGPLSPDFLSASSAPDWNFRKILADIELPTQLAGDLSRSIRSNDIGGWMPHDHSDFPFTLGLAKHIGYADGF